MLEYRLDYTPEANEDIKNIKKSGDKSSINKINKLLKELKKHPKTGTGHPEQLKYRPNCWSRRITKKHRLVYQIKDDVVVVLVLSAFGHYEDN